MPALPRARSPACPSAIGGQWLFAPFVGSLVHATVECVLLSVWPSGPVFAWSGVDPKVEKHIAEIIQKRKSIQEVQRGEAQA